MTNPLPKLDLSILGVQLDNLLEKARAAAEAHNRYLHRQGVLNSYTTGWYEDTLTNSEINGMTVDEGLITWYGSDPEGDSLFMSVPISVLDGSETPEEWAEKTYTRYLRSVEDKKKRDHEKWLATKDKRREQFERLKAEFEDGETDGTTTS